MKNHTSSSQNHSPDISDSSTMKSNNSENSIYKKENNIMNNYDSKKCNYSDKSSLSNSNKSRNSEKSSKSKNSEKSFKSKNREDSKESIYSNYSNKNNLRLKKEKKKEKNNEFEYLEQQSLQNQRINKKKNKNNDNINNIPDPDPNSNMVYLNIYDLDSLSKVVNTVAKTIGTGAFHAGVEIYGNEYSFGYITDGETGITKTIARSHPYHFYRESIPMGYTPLTKEEVNLLVEVMKLQWIGDTYDLLNRNCLNYADYFCNLLDVGGVPEWVMSLQKKITWVKSNINVAATKLKALNKASGIPNFLKFIQKKYKEDTDEYQGCKVIVKS